MDFQNKVWLAEKLGALPHGERGKVAIAADVTPTQLSRMANIDRDAPPKNTQTIPLPKLRAFAAYFQDIPPGLAGSPPPQIIRPEGPEPSEALPAPNAPKFSQFGDYDVEVRGITVGGENGEFYFNGRVRENVRRPPGLMHKKGVFALEISNDSMSPRYEPGEIVFVQERDPIAGDHVVVELCHPDDPDQAGKSFVKKFARRTGRRIYCTQYNPAKEVEFDTAEVKAIYRVFPNGELFG